MFGVKKKISKLEYGEIVKRLIKKSFPSLKDKKIFIYESKWVWYNADASYFLFFSVIRISPHVRKLSDKAKTGLLVHELCHLETFYEKGPVLTLIGTFLYFLSERIYRKVERKNDEKVVSKGYGKELKVFRKWAEKNFKDNRRYQRLYVEE